MELAEAVKRTMERLASEFGGLVFRLFSPATWLAKLRALPLGGALAVYRFTLGR